MNNDFLSDFPSCESDDSTTHSDVSVTFEHLNLDDETHITKGVCGTIASNSVDHDQKTHHSKRIRACVLIK